MHSFLTTYGTSIAAALPQQNSFNLTSKSDIYAVCETQLIQWTVTSLCTVGRTASDKRPINVLHNSGGLPRVVNQHLGQFPDARVNFAFKYGDILEEERVAAVLEAKSVCTLYPGIWRGTFEPNEDHKRLVQEARA